MLQNQSFENSLPDEAFIRRGLDQADLNALRMALYQATGERDLLDIPIDKIPARGGATFMTVVAERAREALKDRALAYLQSGRTSDTVPDDATLRMMMNNMLGEELSDRDFAYRRDIPAFDEFPRAASWTKDRPELPTGYHVAIIGAGVSGIATGIQLKRLGIPFTIYEKRHEVGGTWSINNYPDVRVDTTNFIYQYSFEKNYPWTEYFSRQTEMRAYLDHIARKFGIFEDIRFNTSVEEARFDEERAKWSLDLIKADGSRKTLSVNVLIGATGLFGVPKALDIKGVDQFQGQIVHTANWTKDIALQGRRVAIIGNGSTGVQLLQRVSKEAAHVTVLQRTPQWISPRERYGEPVSPESRWLLDHMPHLWNWSIYSMLAMGLDGQVLQKIDPAWQAQGGLINPRNDKYRQNLTDYIRMKLGDREDLIAKVTPRHAPLARRLIVDNGWYASLLRENVELVTDGIDCLTQTGIRLQDGREIEVDLIIAAIGFETTKYLWPIRIKGRGGVDLHETWNAQGGPRAYLSITVPQFPNLFIHYGPNSQPRSGSLLSWQETWARYSAQSIVAMIEGGLRSMEVRAEICEAYNAEMDREAEGLVWQEAMSKARNYYVDASGRSSVNAAWRVEDYYAYFSPLNLTDYHLE